MIVLIFTCGTTVAELVPELTTLFIRANLECYVPVEALYYSAGYQKCCCHCGRTERLRVTKEAYPICNGCVDYHQKKPVLKRVKPMKKIQQNKQK